MNKVKWLDNGVERFYTDISFFTNPEIGYDKLAVKIAFYNEGRTDNFIRINTGIIGIDYDLTIGVNGIWTLRNK